MPLINTKPTARVVKPPKGIVYSMPGVGKSTFAAQSAAPYVLDCENGLSTVYVHKTGEMDYLDFETSNGFISIGKDLLASSVFVVEE